MNPFKPQLDCRNCKYYQRLGIICKKGHNLPCNATECKDYHGNGSGTNKRKEE